MRMTCDSGSAAPTAYGGTSAPGPYASGSATTHRQPVGPAQPSPAPASAYDERTARPPAAAGATGRHREAPADTERRQEAPAGTRAQP